MRNSLKKTPTGPQPSEAPGLVPFYNKKNLSTRTTKQKGQTATNRTKEKKKKRENKAKKKKNEKKKQKKNKKERRIIRRERRRTKLRSNKGQQS